MAISQSILLLMIDKTQSLSLNNWTFINDSNQTLPRNIFYSIAIWDNITNTIWILGGLRMFII